MNQVCHQCDFTFRETSIQYNRRMRNNGPKTCQDCYRINHAEQRQIERSQKEEKSPEQTLYERATSLKKRYKKISIPFLMKQLKIGPDEASQLGNQIG